MDALLSIVEFQIGIKMNSNSSLLADQTQSKGSQRYRSIVCLPGNPVTSKLTQWMLSKKSETERLIDWEMRLDEPNWLWYSREELEIKDKLVKELWNDLLNEAIGGAFKAIST